MLLNWKFTVTLNSNYVSLFSFLEQYFVLKKGHNFELTFHKSNHYKKQVCFKMRATEVFASKPIDEGAVDNKESEYLTKIFKSFF